MKVSKLNSLALHYSLYLLLALLFTEVFFYQGILNKYLGVQPYILVGIFAVWKLVSRFIFKAKSNQSIFKYGLLYVAPVMAVAVTVLDIAERIQYQNVIFSHFHIHPTAFVTYYLFFICLILLDFDAEILKKNAKKVFFIAPILFYPIVLLRFYNPSLNEVIKSENSVIELAQFTLFLLSAFFSYQLFKKSKTRSKNAKKFVTFIFLGLVLFFAVVAMEEISWGQKLFELEVPEHLAKHNTQSELNIHNNKQVIGKIYYLYAMLSFYGSFFWIIPETIPVVGRFLKSIHIAPFVIPWYLSSYFYVNFLYIVIRFNQRHPVVENAIQKALSVGTIWEWEEYSETFLAVGLFLFVYLLYKSYSEKGSN